MKNIVKLGVAAALGITGTAFAAEGVSHSFIEAGYGYSELGGGALVDGDGFAVGASVELPANVLVDASYRSFDYDGTKIKDLSAGLGYKFALGSALDLTAGASYEKVDGDGGDTDGFGLNLGLRSLVGDKVELAASLKYRDMSDLPSYFGVVLGGRYYVKPQFAVGLDITKGSALLFDDTSFIAKLRYDFGQR